MDRYARIFIAGHRGLVGAALVRTLGNKGYANLLTRTHAELDLTNQAAVNDFFRREQPEYVFLAAAKVGGILANNEYPAKFSRHPGAANEIPRGQDRQQPERHGVGHWHTQSRVHVQRKHGRCLRVPDEPCG